MLERASTCLESGSRQLLRAPTPCLPHRRLLSAPFWHHAPLPTGPCFDFLYPEKTLALLNRLSAHAPDVSSKTQRRQQLFGMRVRQFSTAHKPDSQTEADNEDEMRARIKSEMVRVEMADLLERSTPMAELEKLVGVQTPDKQELAWQLYQAIPQDERRLCRHRLLKNLLEYLDQGGSPIPSRVLEIFNAVAPKLRRPSSYRIAIEAYMALKLVGPAIQLVEELNPKKQYDMLHIGLDRILERTVIYQQWDLSLRIFKTFLANTSTLRGIGPTRRQIRYGDTCPELWTQVKTLPDLLDYVESFLQYVREFKDEFQASNKQRDTLIYFTMTFLPNAMDQVLNVVNPDESFIWDWFTRLFDDLHTTNILPTTACYEYAIMRMLQLPRYQTYTNQRKIWLELYRRYRNDYLERAALPTQAQKPSQKLIAKLIDHHSLNNGMKRVLDHVQDLRTFYPDRPLPPKVLIHLIHTFAEHGDHARVESFLEEFWSRYPEQVNLKLLSALLTVHARRADVEQVLVQFKRIQTEFGLTPDTACWNILLLAYVRADDLDGALECFNSCMDRAVNPDHYTFGPLLGFAAQRGDIEAFETLFSKAKQVGVDLDTNVRARSGYVECFLNAGDPEGATAIAAGMLRSWQAGTLRGHPLTHTWNLLIQHNALNGDLAQARVYYRQMVENSIPLDSWTYCSLMRALIEVKQTNAAYKILRVTMPRNNHRVFGLHYAIVMTGFLRERQFDLAVDAQQRMVERQVPETPSAHSASLQVLGARDLYTLNKRKAKHPNYRLLTVETALEQMLVASTAHAGANREPRSSRHIDPHNIGAVPQSYYGLLISLYNRRSAYDICKKLFRKAQEAAPDSINYATPTTLTAAIMEAHYKAGRYAEIDDIWELAVASAGKLTKTFTQVFDEGSHGPDVNSLFDPLLQQRYVESRIANNRRQILVKPCRIYLRSLFARNDEDVILKSTRTIRDLLVNGFAIDNFTWNELIQQLAQRDLVFEAFKACEQYLMPRFPGWRNLVPGYTRQNIRGYQWMELRHYEIKGASVLPRYKTLVLLAKAYGQVKSDERNGIGYDEESGMWMSRILNEAAPLTTRAIETMPRTNDALQERYFHKAA